MLTTLRDNVLDWMYRSQRQTYGTFPSCFPVFQRTVDVHFSPLSVIHHTFFYQFLHAGVYTCMCNLVLEPYFSLTCPKSNLCILSHVRFYGAHADTKSNYSGNADFPVMFPYSRISCVGLSVSMEWFCGLCLLNTLFQTSCFGNNYCGSRMLSGVWAVWKWLRDVKLQHHGS